MKIQRIETIHFPPLPDDQWTQRQGTSRQASPNCLWVRVFTDEGLCGLGETYYLPRAVAAVIHDLAAPLLLGRDPRDIENHWCNLFALVNFCGYAGAELRAVSALDIALWDLAGQRAGQPIYALLGGRSRASVPVYNTCVSSGNYDDYHAWFSRDPGDLAEDLLAQGVGAMKFWPFDQFGPTLAGPDRPGQDFSIWGGPTAAGALGHRIDADALRRGVRLVEAVRDRVGDRLAIAVEGHARWDFPSAVKIARALEPFDLMWLEEIMPPDNVEAYVELKSRARTPICQSERLFTRFGFRPFIERRATDIVMPDVAWCGGVTEVRKIAALADVHYLPVTLHDTIGPVALWASAHLMLHLPNATIMEHVRGYVDGWYQDVLVDRVPVERGELSLPDRPGLGTRLHDDFAQRPGACVEVSRL